VFKRNQQAVSASEPSIFVGMFKWFRLTLMLLVFVSVCVWSYLKVNDPATLPITKVRALGDFSYVTEEMLHLALTNGVEKSKENKGLSIFENKGFFNIDVDVIKSRIENMAWVKQASVQRVWPDTLVIEVVEHTPVAYWGGDGLVDDAGKVFRPDAKTYPEGLPRFVAINDASKLLADDIAVKCLRYFSDASEMFSNLNLKVVKVTFDARQALTLSLQSGIELILGRQNKLYRLQRFTQIYSTLREKEVLIERIDMRYTNGFSVKWKQQQAVVKPFIKDKRVMVHV